MARPLNEIQLEIITKVQVHPVLGPLLTSISKTAIWRLLTYVVASAVWANEKLFDIHKADVEELINSLKPHSLRWYAEKAKAFQFGYDLVDEADYYDNTGIDETLIDQSMVVSYAAVVEQERGLRIKVARTQGDDLTALSNDQLTAFIEYMARIKDAGVKLNITSGVADSVKTVMDVYYNPLVLNSNGQRNDGTDNEPVQNGYKAYLKSLPFNGLFILQSLQDSLQLIEGVEIITLREVQVKYGALPYQTVDVKYIPDSGYLRILDSDLEINFIANNA